MDWIPFVDARKSRYEQQHGQLDERALVRQGNVAYAAGLALLALGRDAEARHVAEALRGRDDFPTDVADTLAAIAAADGSAYAEAVGSVVRSFETREEYLEDAAVADTALVLARLAERRGL